MTNPSAAVLIDSLDPADGPVETIETHISTLVFQNGWAFKIKRPVRYEFVDLSTMDKRHWICQREIEVNRRFAPDVYDAVIPIRDASGTTIDHAVRMRRMPPERRLSTLVANDERWRRRASEVAASTSSAFVAFCCGAPAETREARLASRPYDPTRPSDATAEVARRMEAAADAWPDVVLIDTTAAIEICRAAVLAALR